LENFEADIPIDLEKDFGKIVEEKKPTVEEKPENTQRRKRKPKKEQDAIVKHDTITIDRIDMLIAAIDKLKVSIDNMISVQTGGQMTIDEYFNSGPGVIRDRMVEVQPEQRQEKVNPETIFYK
jgi:hypothetical protein